MGKIWVEVCLISARGLKRTSSLFKLQWFAVGWIDPDNKYCTTIDASGSGNPVWKTKFSMAVEASELNSQELALYVEVYSMEPIFLRSSLLGTATVVLKEFLDKYNARSEVSKPVEEMGSFQLWKKKSNKPHGFVDISIRISEEREERSSSYPADEEGFNPSKNAGGIKLVSRYGSVDSQRPTHQTLTTYDADEEGSSRYGSADSQTPHQTLTTSQQPEPTNPMPIPQNYSHGGIKLVSRYGSTDSQMPHQTQQLKPSNPMPIPQNYSHGGHGGIKLVSRYGSADLQIPHQTVTKSQQPGPANSISIPQNYSHHPSSGGPSYQPPRTPPPPPPPSNVGYVPNFFPRTDNFGHGYINVPHSVAPPPARGAAPGFGMGLGAGVIAAGAMIFGDDFMSGYGLPSGLRDHPF